MVLHRAHAFSDLENTLDSRFIGDSDQRNTRNGFQRRKEEIENAFQGRRWLLEDDVG
jgi:hypothetical protein